MISKIKIMNLLTTRTVMRKYTESDFESFCDVICNDEVMLHISGKGNPRDVAFKKFKAILETNKENDFYGFYMVILLETNAVIGFAKIVPFEEESLEIGYALLAPFWRKGFTLELIDKMRNQCLEYFPNKKVMAIVNKDNIGSIKVLEKSNFNLYKQGEFKESPCLFFEYLK